MTPKARFFEVPNQTQFIAFYIALIQRFRLGFLAFLIVGLEFEFGIGTGWSQTPVAVPTKSSVSEPIRVLFVGDIMLDNGPGHIISCGKDPFEQCAKTLKAADIRVGNLECVLGDVGTKQVKPFTFGAANDSPKYLLKYFDALSLANNHSLDWGPEGLTEMMRVLQVTGIPIFGAGKTIAESRAPLIMEKKGHRIALLGFNEFYKENYAVSDSRAGNNPLEMDHVLADIRKSKTDLKCDIVIPFLHWGDEMEVQPREDQRKMARQCIDAGASAVIGSHPHVTQTIETYRGAPIVYSLGNFVFDYFPGDPPLWIGWIATVEFSGTGTGLEIEAVSLDASGIPAPTLK